MRRKLMFVLFTLVLLLAVGQTAVVAAGANDSVSPKTAHERENWMPLAEKLDLSDTQVKQLKTLNQNTHKATRNLKIKLMDAKFDLRQLAIDGSDQAARDAKIKEIKNLKLQIRKIEQERHQQVQSILTLEQQATLKEMQCHRHHKGGHF